MCAQPHSSTVHCESEVVLAGKWNPDDAKNTYISGVENPAFDAVGDNLSEKPRTCKNEQPPPPLSPAVESHFGNNWPAPEQLEASSQHEKKRKVRNYYHRQLDLMKSFQEDVKFMEKFSQDEQEVKRGPTQGVVSRSDDLLTKASLAINICLFAAKIVAASLSGSLVVLGSVIDSAMDITVSIMIFLANRAIRRRNLYKYPRGRTRLEPIALIIVSVVMGACSVQVISKALDDVVNGEVDLSLDVATIVIMACTIATKFVLMVVCCMFRSPNTTVLAQDHRNDCISNGVALICVFLASKYWLYLDPIGAILVSIYILVSWLRTGHEHVKQLSGRAAKPEFINRIVKICLDHRPEFKQIDTVYAYHYGTKYLVEVDVVLDENMSLKEAHNIAEPLQRKIEHLPDVERAFVHIDYETEHKPDYEHKVV